MTIPAITDTPAAGTAPTAAGAPPAPGFASTLAQEVARSATPVTLGEMLQIMAAHASPTGVTGLPDSAGPEASASLAAAGTHADGAPGAGNAVIDAAQRYLGVPYKWGGTNPATGLDCSGFVQRVFADLGTNLPRVSADQSRAGTAVGSLAEARPGDLVYWSGRGGRPNHIGIYVGDGQMIHAPRTGDVVKVAPVRSAAPDAIRRIT